jgi:hypothetical protein
MIRKKLGGDRQQLRFEMLDDDEDKDEKLAMDQEPLLKSPFAKVWTKVCLS